MTAFKDITYLAFKYFSNSLLVLAAHKFSRLWAFFCPVFLKSLTGRQLQAKNLKVFMSTNANPGNDLQSRQPGHKGNQKIEFCLM